MTKGLPALVLCFLSLAPHRLTGQPVATQPARIVTEYALTSAHNDEYPDPKFWRLLGSNDGENWEQLDRQTNQVFTARSQRLVVKIPNRTADTYYRLRVDNAGSVQLAELELIGPVVGVASESELDANITAFGAPPLIGSPENAFDGDPSTRWIDFGHGRVTDWIQCQYTLHSEIQITNISQFVVLAQRMATRNPLLNKAPQILSNVTAQATRPVRTLVGYALTSANDVPQRDPRDWRLLGSNDGGKTWAVLDERRGETFGRRFQRRVFSLTNQTACAIYRLQIDSVRVPETLTNGASCVQLAGIEPLCAEKEAGAQFSLAVCAQGDNPPNESAEMAFDDNPETKWLDFAGGHPNKSSWIQWQYLAGDSVPVINLDRLRAAHPRPPGPTMLHLDGVVVSWNSESNTLGFLDETGFQFFNLASSAGQIHAGDRIKLSGRVQFDTKPPMVLNPELVFLGTLPTVADVHAGQPFDQDRHFCIGAAEGLATGISDDPLHVEIRLASENGPGCLLVKLLNPTHARVPLFANCRLRVRGVIEPVFDESGKRVAGVVWAASPDDVALAYPTEKEWNRWPEFSVQSLLRTNSRATQRGIVRLRGVVGDGSAGKTLVLVQGTNQLTAYAEQTISMPPGASVEVVGFLGRKGGTPVLQSAQFHPAPGAQLTEPPKQAPRIDERHPVTEIRRIYELAETLPPTNFPVKIRGVITYIDLSLNDFYIQDGPDAILCSGQFGAGLAPFLRQEGLYVECKGTADTGYPINVNPGSFVTVLGKGQWPVPRRASWDDLMGGNCDSRCVEVEGVVSTVEKQRLTLIVTGGQLMVWINELDKDCEDRLLGSEVRVHGVCAPLLNNRNQRLGVRLLVPSIEQIELVKASPDVPFDMPAVPIRRVMQAGSQNTNQTVRLIKTTGVVTHKEPHLFFVQDGEDGLRVEPRENVDVRPGDRVEIVGLPAPDGFSPKLVQALVRKTGQESLPPARPIDLLSTDVDGGASSQDAARGHIEATLIGRSFNEFVEVLELQNSQSKKMFYAYLPLDTETKPPVPAGSRVRLDGVFKAKTDNIADYGQTITSFEMYLNSPEDITVLERPSWWTARHTLWLLSGLGVVLVLVLGWVGSLRNRVRQRTRELRAEIDGHKCTEAKLEEKTVALEKEIEERKRVQLEVEKTHKELMIASRHAGMAEVATNVLHNIGNVLNSVNVSASLVSDNLKRSKTVNVARVADLMHKHAADLGDFLAHDPKGRQLPAYLDQLAEHLAVEQTSLLNEIDSLKKNIEHIKDIVAMQQSYAKVSGVTETVKVADLVEDALRMNAGALVRHDVQLIREYDPKVPEITVEKHKVLQILVNLIRNAKYACDESSREQKRLTVRVSNGEDRVRVDVIDNGVGIPAENLTKIFKHGFTTRKGGHGFGLHSGALAAREMGGELLAHSDGPDKGAAFTLELPLPKKN